MRHFSDEMLSMAAIFESEEYEIYYQNVVKKQLPHNFIAAYEKSNRFHDWYLVDLLISNTGRQLIKYSRAGSTSLQLGFCSGGDKYLLFFYRNVSSIYIDCSQTNEVSKLSPTGFGRNLCNRFDITEDRQVWHGFSFEGGTIEIGAEKILVKKIHMGLFQ